MAKDRSFILRIEPGTREWAECIRTEFLQLVPDGVPIQVGVIPYSGKYWSHSPVILIGKEGKEEIALFGDLTVQRIRRDGYGSICADGLLGKPDTDRFWTVARELARFAVERMIAKEVMES